MTQFFLFTLGSTIIILKYTVGWSLDDSKVVHLAFVLTVTVNPQTEASMWGFYQSPNMFIQIIELSHFSEQCFLLPVIFLDSTGISTLFGASHLFHNGQGIILSLGKLYLLGFLHIC